MKKMVLVVFLTFIAIAGAQETTKDTTYALVDMMNAMLIMVCCVFIFAIVGTLRNKKLLELVRSAHFFRIKNIISAWTLLGSAVFLYALTEMLYSFNLLDNLQIYKFFKTVFGVLFAAGLFMQYMVLQRYVNQFTKKKH
jgi:amino acid transporter